MGCRDWVGAGAEEIPGWVGFTVPDHTASLALDQAIAPLLVGERVPVFLGPDDLPVDALYPRPGPPRLPGARQQHLNHFVACRGLPALHGGLEEQPEEPQRSRHGHLRLVGQNFARQRSAKLTEDLALAQGQRDGGVLVHRHTITLRAILRNKTLLL